MKVSLTWLVFSLFGAVSLRRPPLGSLPWSPFPEDLPRKSSFQVPDVSNAKTLYKSRMWPIITSGSPSTSSFDPPTYEKSMYIFPPTISSGLQTSKTSPSFSSQTTSLESSASKMSTPSSSTSTNEPSANSYKPRTFEINTFFSSRTATSEPPTSEMRTSSSSPPTFSEPPTSETSTSSSSSSTNESPSTSSSEPPTSETSTSFSSPPTSSEPPTSETSTSSSSSSTNELPSTSSSEPPTSETSITSSSSSTNESHSTSSSEPPTSEMSTSSPSPTTSIEPKNPKTSTLSSFPTTTSEPLTSEMITSSSSSSTNGSSSKTSSEPMTSDTSTSSSFPSMIPMTVDLTCRFSDPFDEGFLNPQSRPYRRYTARIKALLTSGLRNQGLIQVTHIIFNSLLSGSVIVGMTLIGRSLKTLSDSEIVHQVTSAINGTYKGNRCVILATSTSTTISSKSMSGLQPWAVALIVVFSVLGSTLISGVVFLVLRAPRGSAASLP